MEYRTLTRDEIKLIAQIDRSETVEHIYYFRDGQLVCETEHWDYPAWSDEKKQKRIATLEAIYDRGATFFGAFDGEHFAGMSVLGHTPVQTGEARLNLEGLWVSNPYRCKGVGGTLFRLAAQAARERGAKFMYVSASPTDHAVPFYLGQGCRLAQPIDPALFEKEPEDIHLELGLG